MGLDVVNIFIFVLLEMKLLTIITVDLTIGSWGCEIIVRCILNEEYRFCSSQSSMANQI